MQTFGKPPTILKIRILLFMQFFFSFEFAIVADVAAVDVATTIALALLAYKQYTMNASLKEIF